MFLSLFTTVINNLLLLGGLGAFDLYLMQKSEEIVK